jgi:hypothetical protein
VSVPTLLVVVFAAVALGLSAASLALALSARRSARESLSAVRGLAARSRLPSTPQALLVDRRHEDTGPPPGEPERRRHRAPDTGQQPARYARLRAAADARENGHPVDDATAAIPAAGRTIVEEPTTEHPAPTATYRRPPPPLPRPGAIGRDR